MRRRLGYRLWRGLILIGDLNFGLGSKHSRSLALRASIVRFINSLKNIILSSLVKPVVVVVAGSVMARIRHVVAVLVFPIHRHFGTFDALGSISFTVYRGDGFSNRGGRDVLSRGVRNITLERCLIILIGAAITVVDPPPRTHALSVRARRHVGRDSKVGVTVPDAEMLNGKNDEVFWTYGFGIICIRDRESTTVDICFPCGVKVSGVAIIPVCVAHDGFILCTRKSASRPFRTRRYFRTKLSESNIASKLHGCSATGGKGHDGIVDWREVQIAMPPPLVEGKIL